MESADESAHTLETAVAARRAIGLIRAGTRLGKAIPAFTAGTATEQEINGKAYDSDALRRPQSENPVHE
ncbi:hypothetical protein [Actinomadura macrotermitis]|uniref:Uncharacterized protein n=1 Tax=Actinomadura macrotermitis TaxID=2585200 RepID=A0A7K0C1T0_9ACTN|nr:hypothetical protein [Actinomadura macrotermitis]MQY07316.1 hypothetical protein [Actinomadura macrotermitis]